MEHVAVDIGSRKSQLCIRSSDGTIVMEQAVPTVEVVGSLAQRPQCRVILETCAESFGLADGLLAAGHEVRVVPAMLARQLGVGARRLKTDVRDARALSEVSTRIDLPSVHIPSQTARSMKMQCNMRDALVKCRTLLCNEARSYLRSSAIVLRRGTPETLPKRVRGTLDEVPAALEDVLRQLESLNEQIKVASKRLSQLALDNDVTRRLMTVPGVGPVTAVRFVSIVDDVNRFQDAHQLESYLGLVPGEHSSSERRRLTSITKAGNSKMRWTLIQAAWSMWRTAQGRPIGNWANAVSLRRGKRVAVTALARKLAGILYAMWRDGTDYQPLLASSPKPAAPSKEYVLKTRVR